MITGIGLDVVELDRIEKMNKKSSKFRERVLTERELANYETLSPHRQIEFLAGRFAGKEAYAKALGTGIGAACGFQDIMIIANEFGKPELYFKNQSVKGFVSITHTRTIAAAQVVLQA